MHNSSISKDELLKTKYIKSPYWNEISDNTRSAELAAIRISKGILNRHIDIDKFINISVYIKTMAHLAPLIVVSKSINDYLVVLEGHLRLTGYCLASDYIPKEVNVILGISKI